jgi:biotin carboxyl carrier protein
MEIAELEQIARWLEEAGLGLIEITGPHGSVRITMEGQGAIVDRSGVPAPSADPADLLVTAASPGTFCDQHPTRTAPLAPEASAVRAGDIIGLVEVGGIYAPVAAPADGILARRLVAPGTLISYGTPLFDLTAR